MGLFKKRAQQPLAPDVSTQVGGSPVWPVGFLGEQSLQSWWRYVSETIWTGECWIDEEAALGVPAVTGSLSLLASYVTQMPLEAVRDTLPATVIEPSPPIVRNPTGDPRATNITFADWIEPALRDLVLWGNYVAVLGDVDWTGWPNVMYPLMAGTWSVEVRNGMTIYHVGDLEYDPAEIFHVKINARTGELVGRGLMNTNRDTLAAAIACERWAARYFNTGTTPSVHISHPNPDLTQAQADELKGKFMESARSTRAPVVTPVGTEITVLPSDAESAQLVEARKWSNAALAMAIGVQPAMLGLDGPSMTYRNIAEVNQQTINTTVMRYLVPIEQQLTAQCLPRGTRARFAPAALMRPDYGERINQALAAYKGGIIDVDEARAMLDLAPNSQLQGTTTEAVPDAAPDALTTPPQLEVVGSE